MNQKKEETTSVNQERRQFMVWLWRVPVLLFMTGALWALSRAYRVLFLRQPAKLEPRFQALDPIPIISERLVAKEWQEGDWQSLEFNVGNTPAVLIHSPEAIAGGLEVAGKHLVAFSRVCTHQGCVVHLNRNIDAVAAAYNYRPQAPALVCPCHYSVFSVLGEGKAKSGPARLPLPRVKLENRAGVISATGIEVYDS